MMKAINKTHFKFLSLSIFGLILVTNVSAYANKKAGDPIHTDSIISATFSSDGSKILTTTEYGIGKILDLETGEIKSIPFKDPFKEQNYKANDDSAYPAGFTSKHVASVLAPSVRERQIKAQQQNGLHGIYFERLKNGLEVRNLKRADGKVIVIGSEDDKRFVIEHDRTNHYLQRYYYGPVWSANISPDGSKFATASFDGTAKILDLMTEEQITIQHDDAVEYAVFSPDSSKLLTSSETGTVKLLDLNTRSITTFEDSFNPFFSLDSSKIVTNHTDILDLNTGEKISLRDPEWVWDSFFSPDGLKFLVRFEWKVQVLDLKTRNVTTIEHDAETTMASSTTVASFSPDSSKVLTAFRDGRAKMLDLNTGEILTLEEIRDQRSKITKLLHNDDPFIRRHHALTLGGRPAYGESPDPRFVEPLITALSDSDSGVRASAALSLGRIGDSRAVIDLIKLVDNQSEHIQVRRNAALALGLIGDPSAFASLNELLQNENVMLRSAARGALKKITLAEKSFASESSAVIDLEDGVQSSHHSAAASEQKQTESESANFRP